MFSTKIIKLDFLSLNAHELSEGLSYVVAKNIKSKRK